MAEADKKIKELPNNPELDEKILRSAVDRMKIINEEVGALNGTIQLMKTEEKKSLDEGEDEDEQPELGDLMGINDERVVRNPDKFTLKRAEKELDKPEKERSVLYDRIKNIVGDEKASRMYHSAWRKYIF